MKQIRAPAFSLQAQIAELYGELVPEEPEIRADRCWSRIAGQYLINLTFGVILKKELWSGVSMVVVKPHH